MTRVFTKMEIWVEVRRRVLTGELSKRAACREYKIHWQTLEKALNQLVSDLKTIQESSTPQSY